VDYTATRRPGTLSESVTFTRRLDRLHGGGSATTVTVSKATPTVSAWPTASAITFGQTLASSTLSGARLQWRNVRLDNSVHGAQSGNGERERDLYASNTTDYATETGLVSVTVNPPLRLR